MTSKTPVPATRSAGPQAPLWTVALILGVLTAAFFGLVGYQLLRGEPKERGAPATPHAAPAAAEEAPPHEVGPNPSQSLFQDLIARSGIRRLPEEEVLVRAKILEGFSLIFVDAEHPENAPYYQARRAELEAYLASLPPEMVPLLLEILEAEQDFVNRLILLDALGQIGSDLAADALARHFQYAYDNQKATQLARSVSALGAVDSDHSYDLLNDFIASESPAAEEHRFRFVEQLGLHSRREESVPLFLELAGDADRARVRNKAAQALKRTQRFDSAPAIERLLVEEEHPYVRQTMIGALGAVGDRASIEALAEIARNDDKDDTRASAVESIYKIGGDRAKEILREVAETDEDKRVRERAQRNLRKLDEGR